MLNKLMILIFVVISSTGCSFSQENKDNLALVKGFSEVMFDTTVTSEMVVSKYMFANQSSENLDSMRLKAAKHIDAIRNEVDEENGWLMPGFKVANEKRKQIVWLLNVEQLNKLELNLSEEQKRNVYVLLNSDRDEILQYFYVEDGSINSFSLLVKTGSAWFFVY